MDRCTGSPTDWLVHSQHNGTLAERNKLWDTVEAGEVLGGRDYLYSVGARWPEGALYRLGLIGHGCASQAVEILDRRGRCGNANGGAGLEALGIPSDEKYITECCERTHRTIRREDIGFYAAYNMFRRAGIMKRYVDGTASSAQALKAGQATRPLAEMGWAYASGKRI